MMTEHASHLLELVFEQMPVGLVVLDANLRVQRFNQTWAAFVHRYSPRHSRQLAIGTPFFDLIPGTEGVIMPLFEQVLAGDTVQEEASPLEIAGVISYWNVVAAPLREHTQVIGIVLVATDVTAQVQNELDQRQLRTQLEELVAARTRQLSTLLDVSRHVAATLDMEQLLGIILDQLKVVLDYTAATVFSLEGEDLRILSHRGPIPPAAIAELRFSLASAGVNREVIERQEPLIIDDVRGDTPLARTFQATAGPQLETTFGYVRSWMGVPMLVKERVIGMLTLDHSEPDVYTPAQAHLALAFAQQAAVALDNARLYDEARWRADETRTLLAVQQVLTSRLDPDAVLQLIAEEACRLTGASFGTVFLRDGDALRVAVLSPSTTDNGTEQPLSALTSEPEHAIYVGYRMPIHGSATGLALLTGQTVRINDPHDPRVHRDAMQRAQIACLLGVPLMSGKHAIGVISVGNKQSGTFTDDDERVLTMLAPGAVIALENARLYQAEQERRREAEQRRRIAEGLRDILTALNSDRPLHDILDTILAQSRHVLGASAVIIFQLSSDALLSAQASVGIHETATAAFTIPVGQGATGQAVARRQPIAIPHTRAYLTRLTTHEPALQPGQRAILENLINRYAALLAVPLIIKNEVYGALSLYYDEERDFSDEEISLVVAFADQAALAIESARFSEQAQHAAAQEERQRLARELHDAVTQTLFSASLIAEVLPRLWERKPEEGQRRLQELRQLTRGALAEMRTLLLELRPSALVEANLGDVLRQLGEAVTGRARLPVSVTVDASTASGSRATLPPDVQVGLYRIAQEALNNVIKHANANQVTIHLSIQPAQVMLQIADDGCGFDPAQVGTGHFGLRIMRERAAAIGATMHVDSRPDCGTRLTVLWPKEIL